MFVAGLKDTTKVLHISNLSKHVVFKGENAGGFSLSLSFSYSPILYAAVQTSARLYCELYTLSSKYIGTM